MKLLTAVCAGLVAVLLCVCVIAQEAKEHEGMVDKLRRGETYTAKWLAGPRHIWYLEFSQKKICPIRVCIEEGEIEVYYYMLYKITNKDERDHEIDIRVGAWSDKQPCPNKWDKKLKRYRHMADLKYRDTYVPEVVKKVEKKHFLQEANNGKGLFSLKDVTMPEEIEKLTQQGIHGNETGISSSVIKAGETWQCVAVFKRISPEMDYFRIFIDGLTNDFQILTYLDSEQVREHRGTDMVLMKNGEMVRCRAEERLNDVRMFVRNEAGLLDERIEKLIDVQSIHKSGHTRIDPNQRLIVEKIYEVTYKRLGDEFYVSNDWIELEGERRFRWIRVIDVDLPHSPVDLEDVPRPGGPP